MRYHVLAVDYDGTIAHHGKVDAATIDALKACRQSGRHVVLVTGRELPELLQIFPEYEVFTLVVAENGAVIFDPATRQEKLLGERPPASFIDELRAKNVAPLSVGRVIVATWEPHQSTVLEGIRDAGIEYQVIFNKGAVMVLPPGINKAKGLQEALAQLHISMHNVVAAGDAENDQAMLKAAECSVAVANALDAVKKEATWITGADHGAGIAQLVQRLLEDDLASLEHRITANRLTMGKLAGGDDFIVTVHGPGTMIAGTSGGGKSTLTSSFMEVLAETGHQYCIIDPEGDYINFPNSVTAGDGEHEPVINEVITLLENPLHNVVICLLAIPIDKRPHFFNEFITRLSDLRNKTGHPHWFIVDEAHHLLPAETEHSFFHIPDNFHNFLLITTSPKKVSSSIMKYVDTVMVIGEEPGVILEEFASMRGVRAPVISGSLKRGESWVWNISNGSPQLVQTRKPGHVKRRHVKKYATGNMLYNEFFFRGPENKLNLKAANVITFMQMAEGVDDETWLYHLKRHDYSNWFRDAIHDEELAGIVNDIEENDHDAATSKAAVLDYVKERYTL